MNETYTDPGTPPGQTAPPRRPHQDLDRLRRSVDDRYIAGVAGGLGRHFGVDPTVLRVLLAVLTFFGGAGVLIYAVCWLFVPEEGNERAAVNIGSEPRKLMILAAGAVAVVVAMGDAFGGFQAWPIAGLAVVAAIVLIARDRKDERKISREAQARAWAEHRAAAAAGLVPAYEGAPFAATGPATGPAAGPATGPVTGPAPDSDLPGHGMVPPVPPVPPAPPVPPTWQPPQPPFVPPRPRRTGVVWFWPTLALIAIALGSVGLYDADHHVHGGVYPAVALAITGVVLVLGSVVGRPGGLFLIGLVSSGALALASVTGGFEFSGNDLRVTPRTAAEVQSSYTGTNGQIVLDLRRVADPENLAGRSVELKLNAGEIRVLLPRTVSAEIEAEFGFAGGIDVPGYSGGGIQASVERQLVGSREGSAAGADPLELDIEATVGHIEVKVEQP